MRRVRVPQRAATAAGVAAAVVLLVLAGLSTIASAQQAQAEAEERANEARVEVETIMDRVQHLADRLHETTLELEQARDGIERGDVDTAEVIADLRDEIDTLTRHRDDLQDEVFVSRQEVRELKEALAAAERRAAELEQAAD